MPSKAPWAKPGPKRPTPPPDRVPPAPAADQALGLLAARRKVYQQRKPNIIGILSEAALRRFLQDGVAAGIAPAGTQPRPVPGGRPGGSRKHRRADGQRPIGLQLGLSAGPDPSGSFIVLRGRDRAHVVGSPFPPMHRPPPGLAWR